MYSQTAFGWGVFFWVYIKCILQDYISSALISFSCLSPARGLSLRPRRCIFKRNSISMDCFHKLSRPHYNLSWPLYLVHLGSTELDPPLSSKPSTWDATGCHVYATASGRFCTIAPSPHRWCQPPKRLDRDVVTAEAVPEYNKLVVMFKKTSLFWHGAVSYCHEPTWDAPVW